MGNEKTPSKVTASKKTSQKTKTQSSASLHLPKVRPVYLRPSYIALGVIVLILAIFFARVAIWEHGYLNRMEGSERHVTTVTPNGEIDEIDDTEPTAVEVSTYTVAPGKPRYFSIPSINLYNARIVEIGVKASGELSTPYNIYNVGWYNGSSLPGTNGVSIIDGHGGAPGIGVFGNLPARPGRNRGVIAGDLITIEMGPEIGEEKGAVYTYRVVDTATKSLGAEANEYMATAFTSPVRGQGSLTLITCTGDWWQASKTYSQRHFVRAVLENTNS